MPVTSSDTSIKRWPRAESVLRALSDWAAATTRKRPDLVALGYFGSWARGDAGFGSDLDLIAIVDRDDRPPMERGRMWSTESLPVPADLVVYTAAEWQRLQIEDGRFARTLRREAQWLVKDRRSRNPR